jgi:TatA/E family protein of Tat protein translocase
MFDVGMPELIVIFIVALLVFGPKKLPELGRSLGKGLGELKKAMQDVKDSVEEEFRESTSDIRNAVTDVKTQIESEVKATGKTLDSTVKEVKKQVETESVEIQKTLEGAAKDSGSAGESGVEKEVRTSDDSSEKQP